MKPRGKMVSISTLYKYEESHFPLCWHSASCCKPAALRFPTFSIHGYYVLLRVITYLRIVGWVELDNPIYVRDVKTSSGHVCTQ